jgi:uncharacterized repeat protein (TIGR01451 family)
MKIFYIALVVLISVAPLKDLSAQIRAFTPRYSNPSVRGKIVYVSNSIISTAGIGAGNPGTGEPPPTGSSVNSGGTGINIDVDAPTVTKLAFGTAWNYYGFTAAPANDGGGNTWNSTPYVLTGAAWNTGGVGSGAGKYGYNGTQATCIFSGVFPTCTPAPVSAKYTAYYFRNTVNFTAAELSTTFSNIRLNVQRDDGIVIYINGVERARDNMPAGVPAYGTLASSDIAVGATEAVTFNLSPSFFVAGANSIAVEVHTFKAKSADMSFDMEVLGDPTFNSSTSDLAIATTCNNVLFAGLYWGAGQGNSGSNVSWITGETTCKLKIPGALTYTTITSTQTDYHNNTIVAGFAHTGFKCFADITSLVNTANANGTYTVANVASPAGINNAYGGWTLVFVYANSGLPNRNLTVFDGNVVIKSGSAPVDVAISGFLTPPTGTVSCELGAVAYDGDRTSLDSFSFKQSGAPVFYNLTPNPLANLNDMWNSTIGYLGTVVATRNPAFSNTLGYDASIINLPNALNAQLGNSQTSATVRFASPSENYIVQVLSTSISQFNPSFSLQKTSADLNGGLVMGGDIIRYTIAYNNLGNDISTNTMVADQLSNSVGFVPGSLKINGVAKTDASGDDEANYDIVNRKVNFRLGTGANGATGGNVAVNGNGTITFDVVVASSCAITSCSPVIINSARIDYIGLTTSQNLYDSSLHDIGSGCFTPGPVSNTITPSCYTPSDTTIVNLCPSPSTTLPYAKYAGYNFYSAKPFIAANIFNPTTPITASGTYWAFVNNGPGCSDTVRIIILHQNCPDLDEDNDGIPDYVELRNPVALQDADSNGIPNWQDSDFPGFVDINSDGLNDNFDPGADADNDGIANFKDNSWPGFTDTNGDGVNDNFDTDLDGIPDFMDLDSDNDGIPDTVEAGGVDANGDGKIDNFTDPDFDGLSQNVDASLGGVAGSGNGLAAGAGLRDTDGDGIPDYRDTDSDNDGIPDVLEVGGTDADNDGKIDNNADSDADGFADAVDGDVGNDGIAENSANALLNTGADTNGDGRADSYPFKNMDNDGKPNPYDLDSDGDGIVDTREAGFPDTNNDGKADGSVGANNGWSTTIDALGSLTLLNTDGSGNPDFIDIDADNDGIPDNVEGMSTSSYVLPSYADTDGDGIDNVYDNIAGFGGKGITPNDQDGDLVPDYRDTDTDGDGALDIKEGNDINGNCSADDLTTLTGTDTDGDGLDDRFDADNTSAKATSSKMGTGGTFTGDPAPGSTTVVQKCNGGTDRDWRNVAFILNVDFLQISGVLINQSAKLNWVVNCDRIIDHFDVERSNDGIHYIRVAQVPGIGGICKATPFSATDNMVTQVSGTLYYRVKAISTEATAKISPIVVLKSKLVNRIAVSPNPANSYITVSLVSDKTVLAQVRLMDATGKTVLLNIERLVSGSNSIRMEDIRNLKNGIYTIQVIAADEIFNERIIIRH